jgi:hypothetical protein
MPARHAAKSLVPLGFSATAEVSIWGRKAVNQVHSLAPRRNAGRHPPGTFETRATQGKTQQPSKPVEPSVARLRLRRHRQCRAKPGTFYAAIGSAEPGPARSTPPSVVPSHARHLSTQPEPHRFPHGNRRPVTGAGGVGCRDRQAPWMAPASLQGCTCSVSRQPTPPAPPRRNQRLQARTRFNQPPPTPTRAPHRKTGSHAPTSRPGTRQPPHPADTRRATSRR